MSSTYRPIQLNDINQPTSLFSIVPQTDLLVSVASGDTNLKLIQSYDQSIVPIPVGSSEINALDVSHKVNAIVGSQNTISVVDLEIGDKLFDIENIPRGVIPQQDVIHDCKYINDNLIAVSGNRPFLNFYDLRSIESNPTPVASFKCGDDGNVLNSIGYCGNYISVGGSDGVVYSMDLRSHNILADKVSDHPIISLESYKGDVSILMDDHGNIKMYNLATSNFLLHYNINSPPRKLQKNLNVQYIEKYRKIINGSGDGAVCSWNVNPRPESKVPYVADFYEYYVTHFDQHDINTKIINITKYDVERGRMFACSDDGKLHIWENMHFQKDNSNENIKNSSSSSSPNDLLMKYLYLLVRNHVTSTYFSRSPLNYETYSKRLKKISSQIYNQEPIVLSDLIKANRQLQLKNSGTTKIDNSFGIKLCPSNTVLEQDLFNVLFTKRIPKTRTVVSEYLFTEPRPTKIGDVIDATTGFFINQLERNKVADVDIVFASLSLILEQKDYYNCFKLIDNTINSESYADYLKTKFMRLVGSFLGVNLLLIGLQSVYLPLIPHLFLITSNILISSLVYVGFFKINLINNKVGDILWRPYLSVFHKYLHHAEFMAINKIVNHWYENNQINLKNFHSIEARSVKPNLDVFYNNDYILESPDSSKDLQVYLNQELNKRKIVLRESPEELLFLEYYTYQKGKSILNNDSDLKWVEPDQDPAELIKFKINH
ncbi:hypothetical protein G210_1533 [Candida maltosa Xu316]|uniref:Uncharacterized protein n=1 Tax=Candida maltosa (strain Xu316) TaxID=1245528 RepID=M3HKR4_CANMX|nr:hypothetical protein G210_1533 [Candida maltosa Xu316]